MLHFSYDHPRKVVLLYTNQIHKSIQGAKIKSTTIFCDAFYVERKTAINSAISLRADKTAARQTSTNASLLAAIVTAWRRGEKNVINEIAHLFDLHLKAVPKAEKPSKNAEKALTKFYQIIQGENKQ